MSISTASTNFVLAAVEHRRSCYSLTNRSPISDARIHEIVNTIVKHAPSPFNVQSARAVILMKEHHQKLWDIGEACMKRAMPEAAYTALAPKVRGLRAAHGTVMWFEDLAALATLKEKNPGLQQVIPNFIAWTALELEGLGCNLQHYNFMQEFRDRVRKEWNLPETWYLHSQLVFGAPQNGLERIRERTYLPLEDRVTMHGSS